MASSSFDRWLLERALDPRVYGSSAGAPAPVPGPAPQPAPAPRPAPAGLGEARVPLDPDWRGPTSAEGGARTGLGRWWEERDVRRAERAVRPEIDRIDQEAANYVTQREATRRNINAEYDMELRELEERAASGLPRDERRAIDKEIDELEKRRKQTLDELERRTGAGIYEERRAAARTPYDEARTNLEERAHRRATARADRVRAAKFGGVSIAATGLFSGAMMLGNWLGTQKAKENAGDFRARERRELTDRMLDGEQLAPEDLETLQRYMGGSFDALVEIASRANNGDEAAQDLVRDLRSGAIITDEEVEEEAREIGPPDAMGFPTDAEVLQMDLEGGGGDVEPLAPDAIDEDLEGEPLASRSLEDLFSMAAHAGGPADPTLIDEQVAIDREQGYQSFDDALMGAARDVNPDAALTQDLDELQRYAAGEDVEILPDWVNDTLGHVGNAASSALNPFDLGMDVSLEPPFLQFPQRDTGRPADEALAGAYMNVQDLVGAGRQSDTLGPLVRELLGEDAGGDAQRTPEMYIQDEMLANQGALEDQAWNEGQSAPTLTGARDLRTVPIDPVQYQQLADELGYDIDPRRPPDPRLWERMVGEMERRRTGGSPLERPPGPVEAGRAPLPPAQRALMDELEGGFVPPEQREVEGPQIDIDRVIRDMVESDEVAHPRGQMPNASGGGEGGLGAMIDSIVLGATPADAQGDIGARVAEAGELEAEAAAAAAAREAADAEGLDWGSPLTIGDSPIGRWGKEQLGFPEDAEINIPSMRDLFGWDISDTGTAEAEPVEAEPSASTGTRAGSASNAGAGGGDFNASRQADAASLADDAEAAEEELNWINRQLRDRFGMDASERSRAAQAMVSFGTTMAQSPGNVLEGFNAGAGAALEQVQGLEQQEYDREQDAWERSRAEAKDRQEAALARIRKRSDMSKLDQVMEMQALLVSGGMDPDEALEMAERYAGVRSEEAWAGSGGLEDLIAAAASAS